MKRDALVALGAFGTATLFAGCYGSTKNFPRPAPTATAFATATAVPTATASGVRTPAPSATPVQTPSAAPTSTPSQGPTGSPAPTPTPSPSATPTAQPQVVHIGFELTEHTDPTFGPVWYYSPTLDNLANVIHVAAGSQLVFLEDGSGAPHTAGGFGSSGFPPSNDNQNQFNRFGTVIDGSRTWSTGILNHGQMSQAFTVGPPGIYYFGCGFHYTVPPSQTNQSMGDVIVSQ